MLNAGINHLTDRPPIYRSVRDISQSQAD